MTLRDVDYTMAGCKARRVSRGLRARDPNLPYLHTRSGRGPPCKQRCFTQGSAPTVQTLDLRAERGKAFTIFFAGLALTMTTLPKISRFPAFFAAAFILGAMATAGFARRCGQGWRGSNLDKEF